MEDSVHNIYPLLVEHVLVLDRAKSISLIIVRLNDNIKDGGDYRLRVKYLGITSEGLLIAIANQQN